MNRTTQLNKDLMNYGEFITDDEFYDKDKGFIRIRIIKLDGKFYYHKMDNGFVKEIKELI